MLDKKLQEIKEKLYTQNEYGYEYQNTGARLSDEQVSYLESKYEIKTDVHRMCINCQARQIIKYKGEKFDDDYQIDRFQVPCDYAAGTLPPGSKQVLDRLITEKQMDARRALMVLKSTVDPVAWCEMMFNFDDDTKGTEEEWYLRDYQKEQLRCSSLRLVIREGRRAGKTFCMALKLIYLVFNRLVNKGRDSDGNQIKTGPEIMIITPFQSQISNIFSEMEKLLKRNADLCKEVTTGTGGSLYVKTPFLRMEFSNGAKISGFVSGIGNKTDGSGGGTMRGQNANIIYLDEMDMIPDEVIDKVIMPILLTDKGVMMISTSTPIGKRARFFNWCLRNGRFKEDYFPSSVLGEKWEAIKREIEAENTKEGFAAEYMADFIEGGHGVFKSTYVQAARADYSYSDTSQYDFWHHQAGVAETTELIKVMGIDWNKNAGSEFVVVAYSPTQRHYYVIDAVNISAGEFSSVSWKEEVLRLNMKHKPNYIYADEGYGHHIIEDLKLLALQAATKDRKTPFDLETKELSERLVSYNFSSTVELVSPVDGTPIKKTSKDYLVENAVRVFEDQRIWLPESDKAIVDQLQNYVVLRRSPTTNKPVYGPENHAIGDHRLDALMLALAGLSLEFGVYSANRIPASVPAQFNRSEISGAEMVSRGSKMPGVFKGAPGILEITRGSEFENEGQHRGYRNSQTNSRGNIRREEEGSIFDELWNRAYEPAAQGRNSETNKRGSSSGIVRRKSSGSKKRSIVPRKRR